MFTVDGVTTRQAVSADVGAISACVSAAYEPLTELIGRSAAPISADHGALVAIGRAYVAEHDEAIVGVIEMWARNGHWYIENIAVDPTAQGVGVGSLLLDLASVTASSIGLGEIRLYTNVALLQNVAWYRKLGFVETHRSLHEGYERVFFTLTLN